MIFTHSMAILPYFLKLLHGAGLGSRDGDRRARQSTGAYFQAGKRLTHPSGVDWLLKHCSTIDPPESQVACAISPGAIEAGKCNVKVCVFYPSTAQNGNVAFAAGATLGGG